MMTPPTNLPQHPSRYYCAPYTAAWVPSGCGCCGRGRVAGGLSCDHNYSRQKRPAGCPICTGKWTTMKCAAGWISKHHLHLLQPSRQSTCKQTQSMVWATLSPERSDPLWSVI